MAEYKNRPVIFVEQNIDDRKGNRVGRWWAAAQADDPNKVSGTLPFVQTDSGYRYSESDARKYYKQFIDQSLAVPPKLDIVSNQVRVGASQDLRVWGTITNISDETYGYVNEATINVIVYEEKKVQHLNNFTRQAIFDEIVEDLKPGDTIEFDYVITVTGHPNFKKTHAVVLVDYREKPGGRFVSLQANQAKMHERPPAPPNNDLAQATVIDSLPFDITQTTVGATAEQDEVPASCGHGKESSVWFKFTPDQDVTLELDTYGSDFDTVLSVWTGAAQPLTEMACNDDDPNADTTTSWLEVDATAGTEYSIKVSGINGGTGELVLAALDANAEPTPTEQPPPTPTEPPGPTGSTLFIPVAKNGT
jgi:hypothetical protein